MGEVATKICGGEGLLKSLIKEYGDKICKFIAIEKAKQLLDSKLAEGKTLMDGQSVKVKTQIFQEIDGKEKEIQNQFEHYKGIINDKVPGGISSLETLKGQSIEEMLGLNEVKNKFNDLKTNADARFIEEQEKIKQEMNNVVDEQKKALNQQKPSIPLYDDLPERQQKIVFKEGEKLFKNQIKEHEDTILEKVKDSLTPENYLSKLKEIVPLGSLDGLLGDCVSKFKSVSDMLGGGGFGGLAQSIF